ncbi:MAG TPA: alpha/beta hydrolase [Nitrososphaerales archaeon]|nr:alpha/beta hydrolase [Nitrososphaerales archaeon]
MSNVRAGNANLFFLEKGSGVPIIFVHGIPTDYRVWDAQLEVFSRNFRAITYSRRYAFPNKREGNVSDSTVENNSGDLIALIEELGLRTVNLVGHSFGGFVAIYTAWKRPDLLKNLVLIEPAIPSMLVRNEKNPFETLWFLLTNPTTAFSAR